MKDRIAREAMNLFARKGFAGTSMREIAEACDVTKATLYHHFPDKHALYQTAIGQALDEICSRVAAAGADAPDPLTRLRRLVRAQLELFVTESTRIRALYHNLLMPDAEPPDVVSRPMPIHDALIACAEAGYLPQEQVSDTYALLAGGIEFIGVNWLLDPRSPKPTAERGERLIRAALPAVAETAAAATSPTRRPGAGKPNATKPPRRHAIACLVGLGSALSIALAEVASAAEVVGAGDTAAGDTAAGDTVVAIPGSTQVLTLATCLDRALEANPALEAEREGRGELHGQKYQALAIGLPSLDVVTNWSRSRDPSFALDATFGGGGDGFPSTGDDTADAVLAALGEGLVTPAADVPAQTFWRASADLTWEINPFLVRNAVAAAGIGTDRQDAIIADTENRTAERALAAYYDVLRASEQRAALEAEMTARREFLDISRRRFRLDLATGLDTLQAAVSLANLEPDWRRARETVVNAGSRLNVVMGRDPMTPITIESRVDVETDPIDRDAVIALIDRRPDLRALRLLGDIQRKNRGARRAESRPYLSLFGSYGYVATAFDDLGDPDQDTWRASVSLNVPIFDGLLTKGRVDETEATIRRIEFQVEDAERQARYEVQTLVTEVEVARANLRAAELNLARAEEALSMTTLRYENGKADYLAVLNAQADRFVARRNLIDARHSVATETAALKRALGHGPLTPLHDILDATSRSTED